MSCFVPWAGLLNDSRSRKHTKNGDLRILCTKHIGPTPVFGQLWNALKLGGLERARQSMEDETRVQACSFSGSPS